MYKKDLIYHWISAAFGHSSNLTHIFLGFNSLWSKISTYNGV